MNINLCPALADAHDASAASAAHAFHHESHQDPDSNNRYDKVDHKIQDQIRRTVINLFFKGNACFVEPLHQKQIAWIARVVRHGTLTGQCQQFVPLQFDVDF